MPKGVFVILPGFALSGITDTDTVLLIGLPLSLLLSFPM
jgi:hypothetical protein